MPEWNERIITYFYEWTKKEKANNALITFSVYNKLRANVNKWEMRHTKTSKKLRS